MNLSMLRIEENKIRETINHAITENYNLFKEKPTASIAKTMDAAIAACKASSISNRIAFDLIKFKKNSPELYNEEFSQINIIDVFTQQRFIAINTAIEAMETVGWQAKKELQNKFYRILESRSGK